jgi:hypothetical protein
MVWKRHTSTDPNSCAVAVLLMGSSATSCASVAGRGSPKPWGRDALSADHGALRRRPARSCGSSASELATRRSRGGWQSSGCQCGLSRPSVYGRDRYRCCMRSGRTGVKDGLRWKPTLEQSRPAEPGQSRRCRRRAKTSHRHRSIRAPIPGDVVARFPATFRIETRSASSHSAARGGRISLPGKTRKSGRPIPSQANIVDLPPGVSVEPNQSVACESRTFCCLRAR